METAGVSQPCCLAIRKAINKSSLLLPPSTTRRLFQVMLINPVCANTFEHDIEYPNVCLPMRQYILCKLARVSLLRTVFPRTGAASGGTGTHGRNSTPCINYSSLAAHRLGACMATGGLSWFQPSAWEDCWSSWGLLEEPLRGSEEETAGTAGSPDHCA